MRDVEFEHLQSLLEFMYAGEVNISQAELPTFLRTAESLQIRGLTDSQGNQHNNEKVRTNPNIFLLEKKIINCFINYIEYIYRSIRLSVLH